MLEIDTVFDFLCEHGWAEADWIVDGDLKIRSLASRNRNFGIEGPDDIGFVIKQADQLARDGRLSLLAEGAFYELCRLDETLGELSPFLPRMIDRDETSARLVLELIPRATTLGSSLSEGLPIEAGRRLGEGLGTLHRVFRRNGPVDDPRLSWLGRATPGAFFLHRPWPQMLADLSPARLRVIQILQSEPGLDAMIDQLRAQWRVETVIHGDVKFSNILMRDDAGANGSAEASTELWLIDWEMVQLGDPSWDLAGALQAIVYHWVSSMPDDPELEAAERSSQAKFPLDSLQPVVRAFWQGYRSAAGIEPMAAVELLSRAVGFSAVRLIQTTYELSSEQKDLSSRAVLLLQLSANLLANPFFAQIQLYGIPHGSFER